MPKKTAGSSTSLTQLTAQLQGYQRTEKFPARLQAEIGPSDGHMQCLKAALQAACTLEFATIPPYLTALWSIKDELSPVAKSIREVVHEEMLHMSLACNMLASIGGQPNISSALPEYPGPLPGGVHKGLIAKLSGLTKAALSDFLWIERPVDKVPIENPFDQPAKDWDGEIDLTQDVTIGAFYDAIKASFIQGKPPMSPDHQIAGPLAMGVIRDQKGVDWAIELIKHQGEGSTDGPSYTSGENQKKSHFYRFLEVYKETELVWDEKKKKLVHGKPIPFPDIWKMAVVPEGGYRQEDVSADVWHHLDQFDEAYTRMVDLLQGAWTRGGQACFVHAIEEMFNLEKHAKILMQVKIPGEGGKTYGPCFRYKAS